MEAAGGRDPLVNLRQLVQVVEQGGDAEDLVEARKLEMFLDRCSFSPQGTPDQPCRAAPCPSTSPMPFTRTSATRPWA